MAQESFDLSARIIELVLQGVPPQVAIERVQFEYRIRSWPEEWGDYLHVWLYGDIKITSDIEIPELGLHVSSIEKAGDFVFKARSAYLCRVKVESRDWPGALDALWRLETFLSAWHITTLGQAAIQYYCRLFGSYTSVAVYLSDYLGGIRGFLSALRGCQERQKNLIVRAAWWLRQSRYSILTGDYNPSLLAIYSSYWNAFECLTEVVCDMRPLEVPSRIQKAEDVARFFQDLTRAPTPKDMEDCYRRHINPGFPGRARHALKEVFGPVGEQYDEECFRKQPEQDRLYQIRNDINHGNIVEFDQDNRLRVMNGLARLQIIVINMFCRLMGQKVAMPDREIRACHTCVRFDDERRTCQLSLLPAETVYYFHVCDQYRKREHQ